MRTPAPWTRLALRRAGLCWHHCSTRRYHLPAQSDVRYRGPEWPSLRSQTNRSNIWSQYRVVRRPAEFTMLSETTPETSALQGRVVHGWSCSATQDRSPACILLRHAVKPRPPRPIANAPQAQTGRPSRRIVDGTRRGRDPGCSSGVLRVVSLRITRERRRIATSKGWQAWWGPRTWETRSKDQTRHVHRTLRRRG